ncbi:hypothetical protein BKA93DRAFT_815411 [Sparassis latifolia]
MAEQLKKLAPDLWVLIWSLLSGSGGGSHDGSMLSSEELDQVGVGDEEDGEEYWGMDDGWHAPVAEKAAGGNGRKQGKTLAQHHEIQKTVTIISIIMQSIDQQCNALQSTLGIFLHSCNTHEKVVKALARIGISISLSSIHNAIHSLSQASTAGMREYGQTCLVLYAYDNFDIKFNTLVPTIEEPSDTLEHLTSGVILPLEHGVDLEDLRKSPRNDSCTGPLPVHDPRKTMQQLATIHPEADDPSGLTRHGRFNAWPEYFQKFKTELGEPESIEKIPVVKTCRIPVRTMDINQSRVGGNINAIAKLLQQGGVGDPTDKQIQNESSTEEDEEMLQFDEDEAMDIVDITDYVVLIHGDLGTLEQVEIEATRWQRYQYVIFVPGLFHMKMAAADVLWRIFIQPKQARDDENSMLEFVGEFAELEPTFENLVAMAQNMAQNHIAGEGVDLWKMRNQLRELRDGQHENILVMHQYLLLYEELSYAMNAGDIGHVETLFPPWIALFKAKGKHKYGNYMLRFMTDLQFVYPEGLRHAIRYNILFRAVDWVVELLNLFIKDIYGGEGSNYTKKRVIEESPLVLIFRNVHSNIERNFRLSSLSYAHAQKDMWKMFCKLGQNMEKDGPNEH